MKSDIDNISSPGRNQAQTDTFVTGGTLGDMYIVFCKLFDHYRRTGRRIRIIRYSCTNELDGAIKQLFKLAPYVQLEPLCRTNSDNESIDSIREMAKQYPFINQTYHGHPTNVVFSPENKTFDGLTDPEYIKMEPFPICDIPACDIEQDKFHVGVQLNCGSLGRNFRGFSLKWIARLSSSVNELKVIIHILGTGEGYEKSELNQLNIIPNIRNWAGETSFLEWLSLMKSMDAFITLEGFPAFFTMSQKVPTILYDQFAYGIDNSIHPLWRENNTILKINSSRLSRKIRHWKIKYFKQKNLYSPYNIKFIREFITRCILKESKNG